MSSASPESVYGIKLQNMGHGRRLLTFLLFTSQKFNSMDSVKSLVKESRALGNGVRQVCASGEQIVRISVTVWSRASLEAVWANNDARDLTGRFSLAIVALFERLNSCGDAEVVCIAVVAAEICEVVAVQGRELASPPWFIIWVFGKLRGIFGYVHNTDSVAILVQDIFGLVIRGWKGWVM